jgi:pyridoxine 5'-phosphate synthase PdxJ
MAKITEDELKRIEIIKKDSLEIASILGELQYQKITIDLFIDEQKEKIKDLKKEEAKLFQELRDKYGNVNINIETGEFQ